MFFVVVTSFNEGGGMYSRFSQSYQVRLVQILGNIYPRGPLNKQLLPSNHRVIAFWAKRVGNQDRRHTMNNLSCHLAINFRL